MIDVIITCCHRYDLLKRTLESLEGKKGIGRIFIHDDNSFRGGQLQAIDSLMECVSTPFYLHLEEDWECLSDGFVEDAISILDSDPNILSVSLRGNGLKPHNGQRTTLEDGIYLMVDDGDWSGYSYAPAIRRIKDYVRCQGITKWNSKTPYICEKEVGRYYANQGWVFATTEKQYFTHIGYGRTIQNSL